MNAPPSSVVVVWPGEVRATFVSVTRTRRAGCFGSPAIKTVPEIDPVPAASRALSRAGVCAAAAAPQAIAQTRAMASAAGHRMTFTRRSRVLDASPAATVSLVACVASVSSVVGSIQPSMSAASSAIA